MQRRLVWGLATLLCPPAIAGQLPAAPFRYEVRTAMVLESNIEHERVPVGAVGGVVSMGIKLQDRAMRPRIAFAYQVGAHQYSIQDRWNRISHGADLAVSAYLTHRVALHTGGEVSLKGSSEDRDLGDQFALSELLEWDAPSHTTFRVQGTMRLRRFDASADQNAVNRYLDLEIRQRVSRGIRWSVGGRAERNESDDARREYDRWTARSDVRLRGAFGELVLEGKYRQKEYLSRQVDEAPGRPLRHDRQRQFQADWTIHPWTALGITLTYQIEDRRSNDPDKPFLAHQVGFAIQRSW